MKQNNRQAGFSPVMVVIGVLALAGLVFSGWYIWQKSKKSESVSTSNNSASQTDKEASKPTDPSEGGKYLVIKEWGVRFELPENLRGDVEYDIVTSESTDTETAYFEVGKIAKLPGSNCRLTDTDVPGNSGKSGGIGVFVVRSLTQKPTQENAHYQSIIPIDEHWFYVAGMRDACAGNTNDEVELLVQTADSLTNALSSLQLAK